MTPRHLRSFFIMLLMFTCLIPSFGNQRRVCDIHIKQMGKITTEGSPATVKVNIQIEKAYLLGVRDKGRQGNKFYRTSPTVQLPGYYLVSPLSTINEKNIILYEGGSEKISSYESDVKISNSSKDYKIYSVLLIDLSGSITADKGKGYNKKSLLDTIKKAVKKYVKSISLTSNSKLAIYAFDGRKEIIPITTFSSDEKDILKKIDAIDEDFTKDTSTNLYGAVVQGIDLLKDVLNQETSTNLKDCNLIVFTDGTDRAGYLGKDGRDHVITRIRRARNDDNINVFAIGLGREYDRATLEQIGRDGFKAAANMNSVHRAFKSIAKHTEDLAKCHYTLEYKTPTRVAGEEINLKIEVKKGAYKGHFVTSFKLKETNKNEEAPASAENQEPMEEETQTEE